MRTRTSSRICSTPTLEEFLERAKESEARAKKLSESMTEEQMDLEKEVLRRMALKLDFLRNPRFRVPLDRESLRAPKAPPKARFTR